MWHTSHISPYLPISRTLSEEGGEAGWPPVWHSGGRLEQAHSIIASGEGGRISPYLPVSPRISPYLAP